MSKLRGQRELGFRDMHNFDWALVARGTQRVQNNPNALRVKVLKGLQSLELSLLLASEGVRASWCWGNILYGKDVIKEGGLWEIGKGEEVKVGKGAWVSDIEVYKLKPLTEIALELNDIQ